MFPIPSYCILQLKGSYPQPALEARVWITTGFFEIRIFRIFFSWKVEDAKTLIDGLADVLPGPRYIYCYLNLNEETRLGNWRCL